MSVNITDFGQETFDEVVLSSTPRFDIGIFAFGTASRSTHVLTQLRKTIGRALAVENSETEIDPAAKATFEKRFSAEVISIDKLCAELSEVSRLCAGASVGPQRIFVDVSSLSRVSMGRIFACLKVVSLAAPLRLSIGYSLARYGRPPDQPFPSIRRLGPVHQEFSGWGAAPSLPVDAIVSLGYERGKAIGAVEYLEPRNRWVFVPNSPEHRFLQQVKNHNRQLINSGDGVIDYEVLQPADTYFKLMSLVVGLASSARPVLLPFGPKLFFAISLLVAMRVEKAAVWHVDSDDEITTMPLSPSGHGVVLSCWLATSQK